jgi:hypothetical protein
MSTFSGCLKFYLKLANSRYCFGAKMEADAQVSQLEQALLLQAETLAREQLQNAESARARILAESADKLKLAGEREVLAAKVEAERLVRRHSQAAETRLAADLDRLRWALTEATLSGVKTAFQALAQDETRYLACSKPGWLRRRRHCRRAIWWRRCGPRTKNGWRRGGPKSRACRPGTR